MKYIALLFIFIVTSSFCMHPLHISYTKVEISNKTVTLIIKVFPDDLKQAVGNAYHCVDCNKKEIEKYLTSSCKVFLGKKSIPFTFLKSTQQNDAIWYYFSGTISETNNCNIRVENVLLCNMYDDQKNLVIVSCNSAEKGFTLDNKNHSCLFNSAK